MYSMLSVHRTVPVTCFARLSRMSLSSDTAWAVTLATTFVAGLGDGNRCQIVSQSFFCGHHQPGMKRSRDIQRHGSPDSILLGQIDRFTDVFRFSGENNLTGRIHVGDIHVGFLSDLAHIDFVTADERGHGPGRSVASLFHVSSAIRDQSKAGQEVECTGRRVGGEFPER